MYFPRAAAKRLQTLTRHFKVVVLTGARQTGKTTLLRELFPAYAYVTLDLPQDAASAEHTPDEFLARNPPPLVVDEVQYAPALFRHLKALVDRGSAKGRFVLTGSQRFSLMREVTESLAGRAGLLHLYPLSAEELGAAFTERLDRLGLSEVLARGFYPALWDDPELPTIEFHRSYVATWLERDLRQMLDVGSLRDFERFLRACAARTAQLLNRSELARDVGISVPTATHWLSVLQASGLVLLLEPFENHTKRLVKTPKLYLTDVGLTCFLLGLDARSLETWAGTGALWETFVLGELLKWKEAHAPEAGLWFLRTRDGLEVDFLVQRGTRAVLLDAKRAALPQERDARALLAGRELLGRQAGPLALVTPTRKPYPLDARVSVVSGFELAQWLR